MEETNPALGEEFKEVVRTQIRQNDPPETKMAYERLLREGYPEHEVIRQLAVVVAAEVFDVMKEEKPFDHERFVERLNDLPNEPE
ncbi:MAG: hypothetical protein U9Q77_01075 [Candidatus Marinimicrobia bacterium]|nr:hypothetical protein [Candidatus Neomarinimicrobiota bacterium]